MLSLEAGLIARDEIIRWADGIIAAEAYDDDIANISMAFGATDKELGGLLSEEIPTSTLGFSPRVMSFIAAVGASVDIDSYRE